MNLPPVGKHRTAPLRMFQAIAANRVRQNRYAVEDPRIWREQYLNPMMAAAFSESCILADEIPGSVEASHPEFCSPADGVGPLMGLVPKTPCWRPPFDRLWIEMRTDRLSDATSRAWELTYTTKGETKKTMRCTAVGGFFRTAEVNSPVEIVEDYPDLVEAPGGPESVRWIVEYDVWAMIEDGTVVGPGCSGTYFVGRDGNTVAGMSAVLRQYDQSGKKHANPDYKIDPATASRKTLLAEQARLYRFIGSMDVASSDTHVCIACVSTQYLLGYAIGLMACKNITTPVASDGDRRADPGLPRSGVRYRIIKVAPMVRRRGSVADDAGEARPLALHTVRGHFADYRNGRGLFGKYRGLYYVDPHLRGKREAGEVVKDYAPVPEPTP